MHKRCGVKGPDFEDHPGIHKLGVPSHCPVIIRGKNSSRNPPVQDLQPQICDVVLLGHLSGGSLLLPCRGGLVAHGKELG